MLAMYSQFFLIVALDLKVLWLYGKIIEENYNDTTISN